MGIIGKVSKDKVNNARIERDKSENPVSAEPGMGDDAWGFDDGFGSEDVGGADAGADSWGGGSAFGSSAGAFGDAGTGGAWGGFGTGFGSGGGGAFGGGAFGATPSEPVKTAEDQIFEVAKKVFVGFFTFLKELFESFKTATKHSFMGTGHTLVIYGASSTGLGLLLVLFGFQRSLGLSLLIAGILSIGLGVPLFMTMYSRILNEDGSLEEATNLAEEVDPFAETGGWGDDAFSTDFSSLEGDQDFGFSEASGFDSLDDDAFGFGTEDDSDEEEDVDYFSMERLGGTTSSVSTSTNPDKLLESVTVANGMYTRSYLYDITTPILPNINPKFAGVREIKEGTEEFDAWNAVIHEGASQLKTKADVDMPYLIKAEERLMYFHLTVKRVSWIKNLQPLVDEIVKVYSYDEQSGEFNSAIYGSAESVGDFVYITIMRGEQVTVSNKDLYESCKSWVLDPKNEMPVVLGVDKQGRPVTEDFGKVNSVLVAGMPRAGKTWHVQSILAQLMTFKSPEEVQFYIIDPKATTSDFYSMTTPHVRKFVHEPDEILKVLDDLMEVEAVRRSMVFEQASKESGVSIIKIQDYNKHNPDKIMPYLYVLIDEVVTLSEVGKTFKDHFMGRVMEIVSRTPNLGIRLMLIPHLVKNDIIKKNITRLIPYRVSVGGNAEHIEDTLLTKKFTNRLVQQGDMAVATGNDEAKFIHAGIVTSSVDDTAKYFDFLTKLWLKLSPDSYKGSRYEQMQIRKTSGRSSSKAGGNGAKGASEPSTPKVTFTSESSAVTAPVRVKLNAADQQELLRSLNEEEGLTKDDIKLSESDLGFNTWD